MWRVAPWCSGGLLSRAAAHLQRTAYRYITQCSSPDTVLYSVVCIRYGTAHKTKKNDQYVRVDTTDENSARQKTKSRISKHDGETRNGPAIKHRNGKKLAGFSPSYRASQNDSCWNRRTSFPAECQPGLSSRAKSSSLGRVRHACCCSSSVAPAGAPIAVELPEAAGGPVAADAVAVRPLKKWVPEHLRPREAAPAAEVLER